MHWFKENKEKCIMLKEWINQPCSYFAGRNKSQQPRTWHCSRESYLARATYRLLTNLLANRWWQKLIYLRVICGSYLTFLSVFLAPPDEKEVDGKIWIEFDDGDSGFFQLNEIKRIHPDFPVEGKRIVNSPCSATFEFSHYEWNPLALRNTLVGYWLKVILNCGNTDEMKMWSSQL